MKRTPLNRKTPLKRQSARKRRELRETDKLRHAYIEAGGLCEYCGDRRATDCHEITAGAHRHRAVYEPGAQLYLCRECHESLQGLDYDMQATIKCAAIISAINRCHGSEAVRTEDVAIQLIREYAS